MTDLERFMRKVEKVDGCWLWAAATSKGIPVFRANRRTHTASRWLYRQYHDLNSTHLVVTTCGNRHCVNPEHLKSMTKSEFNKPDKSKELERRESIRAVMADALRRPWRKLSNASLGIEDFMP